MASIRFDVQYRLFRFVYQAQLGGWPPKLHFDRVHSGNARRDRISNRNGIVESRWIFHDGIFVRCLGGRRGVDLFFVAHWFLIGVTAQEVI